VAGVKTDWLRSIAKIVSMRRLKRQKIWRQHQAPCRNPRQRSCLFRSGTHRFRAI